MLRVAAGQPLPPSMTTQHQCANIYGWALEARVYAEDPLRGFLPSQGSLLQLVEPRGATAFNIDKDVRACLHFKKRRAV
jgi:acetyl/propionyl-CoA carboxylase alpha subunit